MDYKKEIKKEEKKETPKKIEIKKIKPHSLHR